MRIERTLQPKLGWGGAEKTFLKEEGSWGDSRWVWRQK